MGSNPCGTGEGEPSNDSRRPTSYELGSEFVGCMGAKADAHFYEFTAAADRTGGYVQASVTGTGAGGARLTARLTAYDGTRTADLARFEPEGPGAATTFFVAVAPAQRYRVAIANEGDFTVPYTYKLTTTYTPVLDGFEPNDTLEAATPLAVDAPLQAYMFAGRHRAEDDPVDYHDYYRFTAVSGSVTIRIEDVPPNLAPRLTLFGFDGTEVARVSSGIKGSSVILKSPMPPGSGDLVVRVAPWSDAPQSTGRGSSLPDHFTRPYKLIVSQP